MRKVFIWLILACASTAQASPPPAPPLPRSTLPPGPRLSTPSVPALPDPAPATGRRAEGEAWGRRGRPTIRLGEKREADHPAWRGAGLLPPGQVVVKAKGGEMTALLAASAWSHTVYGIHSESLASLQLVQEFDIVPGSPDDPRVLLSMACRLDGYVRSEQEAAASLRLADAVVYPASGGPAIQLAMPPCCASGDASNRCEGEAATPPLLVPAGHYVLVANLVLETTSAGLFRGHAEAVFAPGKREGTWRSKETRAPVVEGEDFGLAVSVRVVSPPGGGPAD